jgi:hypothetical protein
MPYNRRTYNKSQIDICFIKAKKIYELTTPKRHIFLIKDRQKQNRRTDDRYTLR